MRIAVVGATGMIGHHVARAVVEQGHELVVIHRPSSNLEQLSDLSFRSATGDLNDTDSLKSALRDVDSVINCAAYYPTAPRPWKKEVDRALTQMENFYRACESHSLSRIVYLGAAIALPRHPEGLPGHADLVYPGQPASKNPYLQVKWALDQQAREKAKGGLPVVIGIPSMTFGEYDDVPTTGRLIRDIANQELPAYVRGNRSLIYAGDAGLGLVKACEQGRIGERYIFTTVNTTMDQLMEEIARQAQVTPPRPVPLAAAKTVAKLQAWRYRFLGGDVPTLNDTAIAVLSAGQFLQAEKAEQELGFTPTVGLEEMIRRTLSWFRQQGYVRQ